MPITRLDTLTDSHEKQAAAIVRKRLDNEHWQINPNDIGWIYHWPQVEKQMGRSKRVYLRLLELQR